MSGGRSALLVFSIPLLGCPGPSSRAYEPASEVEAELLGRASRSLRPADVAGLDDPLVVWAGIVRDAKAQDAPNGHPVLDLTVEHRHFDWIEDRSIQPERYFLSPLGDGHFQTRWQLPVEGTADWVLETVHAKDMVVVYGYPDRDEGGRLALERTEYVRLIPAEAWRDDVLEYAPDQETRSLSAPGPIGQPLSEK